MATFKPVALYCRLVSIRFARERRQCTTAYAASSPATGINTISEYMAALLPSAMVGVISLVSSPPFNSVATLRLGLRLGLGLWLTRGLPLVSGDGLVPGLWLLLCAGLWLLSGLCSGLGFNSARMPGLGERLRLGVCCDGLGLRGTFGSSGLSVWLARELGQGVLLFGRAVGLGLSVRLMVGLALSLVMGLSLRVAYGLFGGLLLCAGVAIRDVD